MLGEWGNAEWWARFAIASLVTWRLTHLAVFEDGPFDAMVWLRQKAGDGFFGKLLDCFYCCSVWVAAAVVPMTAWFDDSGPVQVVVMWIALSGSACLLERATAPRG